METKSVITAFMDTYTSHITLDHETFHPTWKIKSVMPEFHAYTQEPYKLGPNNFP
jgi:hypothetical protein